MTSMPTHIASCFLLGLYWGHEKRRSSALATADLVYILAQIYVEIWVQIYSLVRPVNTISMINGEVLD